MPKNTNSGIMGVTIRDLWLKRGEKAGKRWEVIVYDPNTRQRLSKSFADGQLVDAKMWGRATAARYLTGLDSAAQAEWKTVGQELVDSISAAGRSPAYVREFQRIVDALAEQGVRDMKSPSFPIMIRRFLDHGKSFAAHRHTVLTVTAHTRNRWLQEIRSVVRHAINTRRLTFNPLAGLKFATVPKENKETFQPWELRALLDPSREADPYFLRFALMIYTGCRIGEAMHLRWQDVKWEQRVIEVCRQPGVYELKRGKERYVPMMNELVAILRQHAKADGFIVAEENDRDCPGKTHGQRFKDYLRRCGVAPAGRTPHSTRHTWISLMLAMDVNAIQVAAWAGHESLLTTQGYAKAQGAYRQAVSSWTRGDIQLRPGLAVMGTAELTVPYAS